MPSLETTNSDKVTAAAKSQEDIMSVLLAHEKRSSTAAAVKAVIPGQNDSASESSADEDLKELDPSEPGEFTAPRFIHIAPSIDHRGLICLIPNYTTQKRKIMGLFYNYAC